MFPMPKSLEVYSKSNDMFGLATKYDHYTDTYTVELPSGIAVLSSSDLEWSVADYDTDNQS